MRKILILTILLTFAFRGYSQDYTFVLVDVSKSISPNQLTNAKTTLRQFLLGQTLTNGAYVEGTKSVLSSFKIKQNDKLAVVSFGSLNRTKSINPIPIKISNPKNDVEKAINAISWIPTDQKTYYTLAKAKIAEYANSNNIKKYKLYIISDNINDDFGGAFGKAVYPDVYERNLAQGYNTVTNPVIERPQTKVKFDGASSFMFSLYPEVDVSGFNPPITKTPTTTKVTKTKPPKIIITSYNGGTVKIPKQIKNSEKFTISWTCKTCPKRSEYKVQLRGVSGNKHKIQAREVVSNSTSYSDLPSGDYKVYISSTKAKSAQTIISVKSGGSMIWFIILFIILAIVGYYFWDKKRQQYSSPISSEKKQDIFDNNNKQPKEDTNSEYF